MAPPFRHLVSGIKRRLPVATHVVEQFRDVQQRLAAMDHRIRFMQEALGRIEARQSATDAAASLRAHEFKVFSQWGEDGIIDHLVRHVPIARPLFVEFGVESYQEANTRFLLVNRNWSGLVLDGSSWGIGRVRQSHEYWLYNLKAVEAFITAENIDALLAEQGVTGDIGLLSIDIDGMDYWVWKAITVISPAIVVIEYNHRFGIEDAVTVPYEPSFDRRTAHHSILYYGASLKALCQLGDEKEYDFVGVGSAGLNAFFVRRDLRPPTIPARTPEEEFLDGQFCEAHDAAGTRVKMSVEEQRRLVRSLPLVHLDASAGEGAVPGCV